MQDKLRLLHEDLDSERELRQRIERERSDLQCQLIALSDRLEEAEGGAETQCEMNKKRDTELSKLRYVNLSRCECIRGSPILLSSFPEMHPGRAEMLECLEVSFSFVGLSVSGRTSISGKL